MNHDEIVPGQPRTDRQIVDQTNLLAIEFLREAVGTGYTLTDTDTKIYERQDENPRFRRAWDLACRAQEMLTGTDPNDALSALDDERDTPFRFPPMTDQAEIDLMLEYWGPYLRDPQTDAQITDEVNEAGVGSMVEEGMFDAFEQGWQSGVRAERARHEAQRIKDMLEAPTRADGEEAGQ